MQKISEFKENPEELLGQSVLITSHSIGYKNHEISRINKITKTGFRVEFYPDKMYSLIDGSIKRAHSRMNTGSGETCTVISEEEAEELKKKWETHKIKQEKVTFVIENITRQSVNKIGWTKLEAIYNILKS